MRIARPRDVEYLALEGGGGKGGTFLGAIRALERYGILPINMTRRGRNQIRGISGASAGAITALMLAMGLRSNQLEQILNQSQTFIGFFDGPDMGAYRSVDSQNRPQIHADVLSFNLDSFLGSGSTRITQGGLALLFDLLLSQGKLGLPPSHPMNQRLRTDPRRYLFNLLFDRGFFPGFAVRRFLGDSITIYLHQQIPGFMFPAGVNGGNVSFQDFCRFTGVDLVITGTNITRQRSLLFSQRHTPQFPVAEAIGLSMSLPFLFKPVLVEATVPARLNPPNRQEPADYMGYYVDGGMLNNLPLHAFDDLATPCSGNPNLYPLHPNMLGLRLTDGRPNTPPRPPIPRPPTGDGLFYVLGPLVKDLMNTLFFPSEEGQIRNQEESEQTIDLYTYDLDTTNFAPTEAQKETPIREAEASVIAYFPQPPPAARQ
jgi:NTE family protein